MSGRYKIVERLDQGGMAEVYRGVAESIAGFKKSVAIKRMLPNLAKNQKFVQMFLDEAKLSLYLQHANIVQVFDISRSGETYFLVMEYVDGANLKKIIERMQHRGRTIPVAQSIYIALECCKALHYAHNLESPETYEPLGLVHRDVSPPNVLVSKMGEVKLVDFGLAKATSQITITDPGVVKGKFSYLSPEAASGLEVDARADVFALGIILWELFTGQRLFSGENDYQTVQQVREARIPSIAAVNPDIEPELEAIVRRALARDPRDRYQDAADLSDPLAQYLFNRGMKVTARDIAGLVRDTLAEPKPRGGDSLVDTLLLHEMAKVTSLVEEEKAKPPTWRAEKPEDDGGFEDPSSWLADFDLDD